MKLSKLICNLSQCFEKNGEFDISDIFRNDFGDELVLEGVKYKRLYIKFDLNE